MSSCSSHDTIVQVQFTVYPSFFCVVLFMAHFMWVTSPFCYVLVVLFLLSVISSFRHFCICLIMSSDNPVAGKFAVAIKGTRKRSRDDSVSSDDGGRFTGCRDSPSPTRAGPHRRAARSRPKHHRVVLETPKMRRHELEYRLVKLWHEFGLEYKFDCSSSDIVVVDFFGGTTSSTASGTFIASSIGSSRWIMTAHPSRSDSGNAAGLRVSVPVSSTQHDQHPATASIQERQ